MVGLLSCTVMWARRFPKGTSLLASDSVEQMSNPASLKSTIRVTYLHTAFRYYTKARDVLHQYSHMPSFQGIHQDCDEIVNQLRIQLREQLRNPKVQTTCTVPISEVKVTWLYMYKDDTCTVGCVCSHGCTLA